MAKAWNSLLYAQPLFHYNDQCLITLKLKPNKIHLVTSLFEHLEVIMEQIIKTMIVMMILSERSDVSSYDKFCHRQMAMMNVMMTLSRAEMTIRKAMIA